MPLSYCAFGCTNRYFSGTKKHFFRIPANEDQRIKWIAAINRKNWTPTEGTRLCSDHFTTGKFCQSEMHHRLLMECLVAFTARAATYSTYKKNNTVKVFIGIAPTSAITFISSEEECQIK